MKRRQIRLDRFLSAGLLLLGITSCASLPRIVILHDALSAEEHLQLGMTYESQGLLDLAISEYQAALEKRGSLPLIKGMLGNIYYTKKEYTAAETAYRWALRSEPQNAPILNNLANLYLVQGKKLKEAERLVRKALALDQARRLVYLDTLGSIYSARGEYPAALSIYKEAEGLETHNPSLKSHIRKNKKRTETLLRDKNRFPKIEGNSGVR